MLLTVSAVGGLGQAGPGRQRVVEAERFVLRDAKGEERGAFAISDDGDARMTLKANKGLSSAEVSVGSAYCTLSDVVGTQRSVYDGAAILGGGRPVFFFPIRKGR
jgi:hypothetical protein